MRRKRYRLRRALGLCARCGEEAIEGVHCEVHAEQNREKKRKYDLEVRELKR